VHILEVEERVQTCNANFQTDGDRKTKRTHSQRVLLNLVRNRDLAARSLRTDEKKSATEKTNSTIKRGKKRHVRRRRYFLFLPTICFSDHV
jgi:hypothetical protein